MVEKRESARSTKSKKKKSQIWCRCVSLDELSDIEVIFSFHYHLFLKKTNKVKILRGRDKFELIHGYRSYMPYKTFFSPLHNNVSSHIKQTPT